MIDQIWNPYVDEKGKICVDIFKDRWSPALTTRTALLSLISLFSETKLETE